LLKKHSLRSSLTAAAKAAAGNKPVIAVLNNLRKKSLLRDSLTSGAKAAAESMRVIAAVNRCATQNQVQHRLFPQAVKRCATQNQA
jgi:hypothetical protein